MDRCPECGETMQDALVICGHCGQILPLRVVVVSEGSHGGGFALVEEEEQEQQEQEERISKRGERFRGTHG